LFGDKWWVGETGYIRGGESGEAADPEAGAKGAGGG